jgi:hypothetical protein
MHAGRQQPPSHCQAAASGPHLLVPCALVAGGALGELHQVEGPPCSRLLLLQLLEPCLRGNERRGELLQGGFEVALARRPLVELLLRGQAGTRRAGGWGGVRGRKATGSVRGTTRHYTAASEASPGRRVLQPVQ